MSQALLIMHPDSVYSYYDELRSLGEYAGDALDALTAMGGAVDSFNGVTVVVTQNWVQSGLTGATAQELEQTLQEMRDACDVLIEFDEMEAEWDDFFVELSSELEAHDISRVVLGGAWWSETGTSGCATAVASFLRSQGYAVSPRDDLLICELD